MKKVAKRAVFIVALGSVAAMAADAKGVFTADQYKKALWMTTRYFGAVRSGTGPNWATQDSKYPTSFVKDSYKGNDVSGGWFDCGDHVMFGQTQFYAAYILAKGFATWRNGFPDDYTGDFSDYKASQDYSMAGGKKNGLADVLEELRYEADFFVKITPTAADFVHQKGEGGPDHKWWIHSGRMSTMPNSEGGERDGSRKILGASEVNDGNMPGQAAAMLAVMARVDPDPARRATYLEHAKNAYAYSKSESGTQDAPGFYSKNYGILDAQLNAATELWLTTGQAQYKSEAEAIARNSNFTFNSYWRLDYENDEAIAMMNAKYVLGVDLGTAEKRDIVKWLKDVWASAPTGVSQKNASQFPLRGLSGYTFLTALYATYTNDRSHDQFILNQIDYMLGSNSGNQTYLVGWDEGGKKQPTAPHIRNYYLNEDTLKNTPGAVASPAKMKYLGAMLGGKLDGGYDNSILNLSCNEPCAELNAPVVATLGYIVSRLAPVDTTNTGVSRARAVRSSGELLAYRVAGGYSFRTWNNEHLDRLEVVSMDGRNLFTSQASGTEIHWSGASASGIAIVRAFRGNQEYRTSMRIDGNR